MKVIAECINTIKNTGGRNAKIDLLKEYSTIEGFKEVMQFIYNPYIRTGIAARKLKNGNTADVDNITYTEMIEYFTANQTGSDASVKQAWMFINNQETEVAKEMAEALVTKNLKIGVSEKTLNNVYGNGFIPMVGCMLGSPYEDNKQKVKGPYIVTEKMDGVRRLLIKENGVSTMYSRAGIIDEGLVDILAEAKHLPDNTVYDGELLAIGDYDNCIALRQATNSIAASSGDRTGLTFNIFDIIPIEEYKLGISEYTAENRKVLLGAMFDDSGVSHLRDDWAKLNVAFALPKVFNVIKATPILGVARTESEIYEMVQPIFDRGGEGIMLNTMDGYYEIKRTKQLLKVKRTETMTLKVVDIQEGTNKNEGKTGSLIVDYKGNRVGVGSGLSDDEREQYWTDPSTIIGKTIIVDTFGESIDKLGNVSLNCPIYKEVYNEI